MKRRTAMLLSVVAVGTALTTFSPVSPASADTDVCAGQGSTTTGAPLFYPTLSPGTLTLFFFSLTLGVCITKTTLTASGTVHGWCGLSTGAGTTGNGHDFMWTGVGDTLVIAGELTGTANVTANPIAGENCDTGADGFLVTATVTLLHPN